MSSNRTLQTNDLPPIIALHTSTQRAEDIDLWRDKKGQTFLKPRIKIGGLKELEDGTKEDGGVELEYQIRVSVPSQTCLTMTYVRFIQALVVEIVEKDKHSHLVAIVKVPQAESRKDLASPWFVFNDFHVQNVSEQEALSFLGKWKVKNVRVTLAVHPIDVMDTRYLQWSTWSASIWKAR